MLSGPSGSGKAFEDSLSICLKYFKIDKIKKITVHTFSQRGHSRDNVVSHEIDLKIGKKNFGELLVICQIRQSFYRQSFLAHGICKFCMQPFTKSERQCLLALWFSLIQNIHSYIIDLATDQISA